MACHQPGERPPREPDPAPWYAAPAVAGWRAMSTLTQVTEARLALRRRLAIMRPDTGAEPDPAPVGRDQPTWACRSVVIVRASPRVSIPLVLTTPGLIQIDYSCIGERGIAPLGRQIFANYARPWLPRIDARGPIRSQLRRFRFALRSRCVTGTW